jgi:hypothetical protein
MAQTCCADSTEQMEPPGPVGPPGPGGGDQPGGGGGGSANQCQITISGPGTFVGQFVSGGGGGGGGGAAGGAAGGTAGGATRALVSTFRYICIN